ncbi:hypothetical protein OM076_22395 [Solirubrobacter ginsenosidimutans]|uniref:Intracellular proteinase inhibitor BsuPI domain-containing protein n=1 Tax=Solirubrobacter ginsenosidimutans TaxID=490573 RepID=A0A9X3MXB8_9ACTN|nr:hypothetical protein [Solirubrobacter ginsenosidimutans]MDA0163040.1 hypothetical protein [Solirubrobacter ginsenosidimutans]
MARAQLTDIPGRPPPSGSEIAALSATLDVGDEQPALQATVTLEHHGDARVSLLDPWDMLQWQLLDERGAPLALPPRAPALLTGRNSETVTLDPGGRRSTTVELDQLAGGRPITAGAYSLGVIATLIDADDTERSRILRADPLPVRLGQ